MEKPRVPYEASTRRRFDVSHDEYSRERIYALRDVYRTLKEECPFFAGITLFGSLSKGKRLTSSTAEHTDMDIIAFIDEEKYKEHINDYENNHEKFREYTEWAIKNHPRVLAGYPNPQESVRPQNLRRATEMWIEKRIREIVENRVSKGVLDPEQIKAECHLISNNTSNYDSLFNQVVSYEEDVKEFGHLGPDSELRYPIAAAFFLDVGGGLAPYKKAFMEQMLSLQAEDREKHWQTVVHSMKEWERKHDIPPNLAQAYPETFEEALKKYA